MTTQGDKKISQLQESDQVISEFTKLSHFRDFFRNDGMRARWFTWRVIKEAKKEFVKRFPWLKDVEYIAWDKTHKELEAYNSTGAHLGALEPETLEFCKLTDIVRRLPKKS